MLAECCRLPKNRVPRLRRECALINVGFGWPIHPRAANWVDEPNRDDVRRICVHAVFSGSLVLIQPTLLSHITMEVTGLRPATLSSEFRQRPQLRVHRFVIGCFVSAGALRKNSWPLYFRVVTHTLVPQCEHRQPPTFIVSPIQTGIHNPAVTKESRRWRT